MTDLTIKQKKEWAKTLYLNDNMKQKEIAVKVGVTEKTLSKWINDPDENWDMLKSSVIITKEQELRRIYMQINELNTLIMSRAVGSRFSNTKEADTLSKLTASARSLETDASVADIIEVFKRFLTWLREFDLPKAKELSDLQDAFIKHVMR
jgi:transcriptional regulator with XRE-family HTH domain